VSDRISSPWSIGEYDSSGCTWICIHTLRSTAKFISKSPHQRHKRPWIGISGDCAAAAYILRPRLTATKTSKGDSNTVAEVTDFELLCEISCGATIGSLAIGYDNFCVLPQQQDFSKISIPCYEKDKILVFALGDGTGP